MINPQDVETISVLKDAASSAIYGVVNKNIAKKFNEERDYLYPVPVQEMLLNSNLMQNPGWQ